MDTKKYLPPSVHENERTLTFLLEASGRFLANAD
jgi:hypothetical protein